MRNWKLAVGALVAAAVFVPAGVGLGSALSGGGGVQLCASPGNGAIKLGTGGCQKSDTALPAFVTQNDVAAVQAQVDALQATVNSQAQQIAALDTRIGDTYSSLYARDDAYAQILDAKITKTYYQAACMVANHEYYHHGIIINDVPGNPYC